MEIKKQLELIGKSYDKSIELGKKGVKEYNDLPDYIVNNPNYQTYIDSEIEDSISDSGRKELKEFIVPEQKTNFVDLGCCLNLMFNGYDKWPSTYYGVDISSKTIELLKEYASRENIQVGGLHCGSIHDTPYQDNFFDYGACIGVLEYFERDFIVNAIEEAHRIIKPNGKFIVDIPNKKSQVYKVIMDIEEHIGRPSIFNISSEDFENIIDDYFRIEKINHLGSGAMTQYFLRCKKD